MTRMKSIGLQRAQDRAAGKAIARHAAEPSRVVLGTKRREQPYIMDIPTPPSVNAMFANIPGRGRVKTVAYKRWRTEAGAHIRGPFETLTGPVRCVIEITRTNMRRDLDNCAKAVLDLLVDLAVIMDDSLVEEITLRWRLVADNPPGATVTVSEMEAASA